MPNNIPQSITDALSSQTVVDGLRRLAKKHALMLDKWDLLEGIVRDILDGKMAASSLKEEIIEQLGVSDDVASELFYDVVTEILTPVREALERELDHPEAQDAAISDVEAFANSVQARGEQPVSEVAAEAPVNPNATVSFSPEELQAAQAAQVEAAPAATPTTPQTPTKNPIVNVPTVGEHYKPGQGSLDRKQIDGDPYREPIE